MQIHKTTYNSSPPPKANREKSNTALHIQVGIGVAAPNPPHTPPIILSVDDLVIVLRFCQVLMDCLQVEPQVSKNQGMSGEIRNAIREAFHSGSDP